jgi:hypothetical protein
MLSLIAYGRQCEEQRKSRGPAPMVRQEGIGAGAHRTWSAAWLTSGLSRAQGMASWRRAVMSVGRADGVRDWGTKCSSPHGLPCPHTHGSSIGEASPFQQGGPAKSSLKNEKVSRPLVVPGVAVSPETVLRYGPTSDGGDSCRR